jgi:hypothetical protein
VIAIIADSINPQTKAVAANIATASIGLSTFLDLLPPIIGVVSALVALALSAVLTRNAVLKSRRDEEMHNLKMRLIKHQLEKIENED